MRPNFLIVGAMKAGTTTLYDDLAVHPNVNMPSDKEPDILHRCADPDDALAMWRGHFGSDQTELSCGEASTFYTMAPEFECVASLARQALGDDARIIYLVREPIARIESHLAHDIAASRITPDEVESAALNESRYVSWSDYGRQIKPWIEAFGRDRVLIIRFDDFVSKRHQTACQIATFIGLDAEQLPERDAVSNSRESLRTMRSGWIANIVSKTVYRQKLRALMPEILRDALRKGFTKPAINEKVTLSDATRRELRQRLSHVHGDLKALGVSVDNWLD